LGLLVALSGSAWYFIAQQSGAPVASQVGEGDLDAPERHAVNVVGASTTQLTSAGALDPPSSSSAEAIAVLDEESGLSNGAVRGVVTKNMAGIRACYETALRGNAALSGTVKVRFVVSPDGSVKEASAGGSDLPESSVVECIVKRFGEMSFPASDEETSVVYPVRLSPG
jgi:hypothetical protein